jgi:hypothetical protein
MEAQHGVRYRVNVSTSTKGYHSYDATVEITVSEERMQSLIDAAGTAAAGAAAALIESDKLVAALEARYPNGEIAAF